MGISNWQKTSLYAGGASLCLVLSGQIFALGQNAPAATPTVARVIEEVITQDAGKADTPDQVKAKKEVAELEAQRAKIDEKIRDVRKKAGLKSETIIMRSGNFSPFAGNNADWSKQVKQAMEEAHRAMEEAMKAMHKEMAGKSIQDMNGTAHKEIRILRNGPDGLTVVPGTPLDPTKLGGNFEADLFREHMKKAAEELRTNTVRVFANPNIIHEEQSDRVLAPHVEYRISTTEPSGRAGLPPAAIAGKVNVNTRVEQNGVMDEIRKLREEVRQLREEMRKKGDKGAATSGSSDARPSTTGNVSIYRSSGLATAAQSYTLNTKRLRSNYSKLGIPSASSAGTTIEVRRMQEDVKKLTDDVKYVPTENRWGGYGDLVPDN